MQAGEPLGDGDGKGSSAPDRSAARTAAILASTDSSGYDASLVVSGTS